MQFVIYRKPTLESFVDNPATAALGALSPKEPTRPIYRSIESE